MFLFLLLGSVVSSSAFVDLFLEISNCTNNEFSCGNLKCILKELRCDGKVDCIDGSDELDCERYLCKEPNYFRCDNKICIAHSFVCDGENDCQDFSDEIHCDSYKPPVATTTCDKGHWQCTDKLCIPEEWVCNGESDCLDGSDEGIGCTSKIHCDGFKCKNGHCVPNEWICDGHDDCNDNSDETDCENHVPLDQCNIDHRKFLCSNNKTCIDVVHACDSHPHCPDKSDESSLCTLPALSCKKHGCSHECLQLPLGPKCVCPKGYHNVDEKTCEDINECEQYGICDQKCRNTAGSYECYCEHKYVLQDDKRTCKVIGGEALMVFSSKSEIRAFTLNSHIYFSVAKDLNQVVGIDYNGHHIYWTDVFAEHESLMRSLEDGSEKEVLLTSGLGMPEDLAVDWLTGNIYFTDAEKQHIAVCSSSGYTCTVLVNKNLRKPRGIVLNIDEGDMYWTDWQKPAEIVHAMMDGTHDRPFIRDDIHWPNGLALDTPNERLYWTDARKMTLESVRFDGTDRRIVLEGIVKHPYAISVFENKLYWSDWGTHSIQACDKFTGKDHHTLIKEEKDYIYGLSIFHSALQKRMDNPCSLAFCSDLCLLSGRNYSCACPQNKILSQDGHMCKDIEVKQMLVVGFKNTLIHVEHQQLGKHNIATLPSVAKHIGSLTYNSLKNAIMLSDLETKKIISLNLNSGVAETLGVNDLGRISDMDYDARGNNLYVCDKDRGVLEVINLNTLSRKILLHDMHGEIIESVAVVPDEGVMFVALKRKGGKNSHIDRIYMDGTMRTHSKETGLEGPITLHYDENLHVVFFADAGSGTIHFTSVEGDDVHLFRSSAQPVGLASLNNDLFWVNDNSRRLYWADKKSFSTYNKKITLDIPEDPGRLHIVSVTPPHSKPSACQINNNGCSHLCLISHKFTTCACPTGWELSNDNRTCVQRAHCDSDEFTCPLSNTCILKELRCNGHNDCVHGEDELNCNATKCVQGFFRCSNGDCITNSRVCDKNFDCKDKSDEHNCLDHNLKRICPPQHYECADGKCIAQRFLCDGISDCDDSSDERDCKAFNCDSSMFRCDSGSCIPKSWECDNEFDCTDYSDEHAMCSSRTCAPSLFTCGNGRCIQKTLVCDKDDDCGDNSDEISCHHPAQSANQCNGIDEFACTSNTSICLPVSVKCNKVFDCPQGEDETHCSTCMDEEFTCLNKQCIPLQWTCDKLDDCGDNSDESAILCSNSSNERNVTATSANNGGHVACDGGFRCKSGDCINIINVCNGVQDCYDGSDEGGLCSTSCLDGNVCAHECIKTPHGEMCSCKQGYKLQRDGRSCIDEDECQLQPAICSQLCHNSDGSYSCDCYDKFVLRADKRSCKAEGDPMTVIFTTDEQIRQFDQKNRTLSILFSQNIARVTGLEALVRPQAIFFSLEAASAIQKVDMDTQMLHYMQNVGRPQKIALDWATENIYFYNSDPLEQSIGICNFNDKLCAKLIDIEPHKQVSVLAVDSVNRILVYALSSWWIFNSPTYSIHRCNLDGSDNQLLVKTSTGYITGLTLDYNRKQMYYFEQHSGQIQSMSYQGTSNTVLHTNVTRADSLKLFEDSLYYVGHNNFIFKCRVYGSNVCDKFKLQSNSIDMFTILQDTLQPQLNNVCKEHTCSLLCLPSDESQYKCLCKNGEVIASSQQCPSINHDSTDEDRYKVHSIPVSDGKADKRNTGAIVPAILIPAFVIITAATLVYVLRKKHNGNLTYSMRFFNTNPDVNQDGMEKSILQPGQHEYENPYNDDDITVAMS